MQGNGFGNIAFKLNQTCSERHNRRLNAIVNG
jgi:hypothetical protein